MGGARLTTGIRGYERAERRGEGKAMRLVLMRPVRNDSVSEEVAWDVGAAVARTAPGGGVMLELGPADGPPHLRLSLSSAEALRLASTVQNVAANGGEEILIVDDDR